MKGAALAGGQELADAIGAAPLGEVGGRPPFIVREEGLGAGVEQVLHHRDLPGARGHVQRGRVAEADGGEAREQNNRYRRQPLPER